jgi:hypothetical protein
MYRYCFFNLGDRWGGQSTPRTGRFTPEKETRYPLYRRLGGPQGRSGRENLAPLPTGIRSTDRPARSKSLYRLGYPGLRSAGVRLARSPLLDRSKGRSQTKGTAG